MPTVLLIEDDQRIRAALGRALADRGHAVLYATGGMEGLERALAEDPEVIVLDLGLPDLDGTDVLRMVRSVTDVPVIIATARDDENEIVRTLDAGADDYVVKPFTGAQLDARLRAVLRRSGTSAPRRLVVGELEIDRAAREASLAGEPLDLSRLEFDLLAFLASRPGEVVNRRELFAEVWREPLGGADRTLDVHLSWLRRKLGETAAEPRYLHTVRGVGVKLVAPA